MKKTKYIAILGLALLAGLVTSCFKDNSSLDLNEIDGVEIDTTGMNAFSVYQFDRLVVEPNLETSNLSESDLLYEWQINLEPGDTLYQVIGEEKNLDFEVAFKPNVSGEHHQLLYTVTDKTTGLEYIMTWPVTVKNNIGEGLVIAETSDGVTTDISHIMASEVTQDYNSVSVKHGVYSSINGTTIQGLIKQMRFVKIYGVDALLGITDESMVRINTLDYTFGGRNDDLFYTSTENYQPQALYAAPQADIYIGNGRLTSTYLGASRSFGLPFDAANALPDHVAVNPFNYYPLPVRISFYDEANELFTYIPSLSAWGDRNMYTTPAAVGAAFDPASVKNKINLAAGVSTSGDFRHVLKDKTTGEIGLYVLNGGGDNYPQVIPPAPKAFFDLSEAPEIDQATEFVLMDNQKVMFYASSNTIYAVLYSSGTPVFEERYTVPAGEEITTLQVYTQANYPFRSEDYDPPYLATNNKQLILSTYSGSEGKVYLLPLINAGIGNIDTGQIKTFGGFDRITAITTQL